MKTATKIMLFVFFLATMSWVAEGVADYYTFHAGTGDIKNALIYVSTNELISRGAVFLAFIILGVVITIASARKARAEETLRESEDKYRDLVERTSDWVWEVNENGIYTYSSPRVQNMLGYKPEEVVGKTPFQLMPPEEAVRVRRIFSDLLSAQKEIKLVENIMLHKDGHYVFVETNGLPIIDSHGKMRGYRGTDRDISERKNTEQALWESMQMLKLVLDTIPVHVFWKDVNSVFLGCNQQLAQDAGLSSPDEIIGKTDFDLPWNREQSEQYRDDDRMVVETGIPKLNYEETQIREDGSLTWLRTSKVPLRDVDGNIIGIMGCYEDITELKKWAQELAEAEAKYRSLVEQSVMGVYLIQDGRFAYANPCLAQIFDYTPEELLGQPVGELVAPEDRALVMENIRARLSGETPTARYAFRALRKDGEIIDVEVIGSMIYYKGKPAIIGSLMDVTERLKAEQERRQFYRDTIRSATQGKLELVSSEVIHEYLDSAELHIKVSSPLEIQLARHELVAYCASQGIASAELALFETAIGEAAANAVKHANSGEVYAGKRNQSVWVAVSDEGPGISALTLPYATLRKGFSTKISMGMGYSIMLEASDTILLYTGPAGTTVIMLLATNESETAASLDDLPDTWSTIPSV